jgi:hypothetical protein
MSICVTFEKSNSCSRVFFENDSTYIVNHSLSGSSNRLEGAGILDFGVAIFIFIWCGWSLVTCVDMHYFLKLTNSNPMMVRLSCDNP